MLQDTDRTCGLKGHHSHTCKTQRKSAAEGNKSSFEVWDVLLDGGILLILEPVHEGLNPTGISVLPVLKDDVIKWKNTVKVCVC